MPETECKRKHKMSYEMFFGMTPAQKENIANAALKRSATSSKPTRKELETGRLDKTRFRAGDARPRPGGGAGAARPRPGDGGGAGGGAGAARPRTGDGGGADGGAGGYGDEADEPIELSGDSESDNESDSAVTKRIKRLTRGYDKEDQDEASENAARRLHEEEQVKASEKLAWRLHKEEQERTNARHPTSKPQQWPFDS